MPVPERLTAVRVAAAPAALDQAAWREGTLVLRLAADEVLVVGDDPGSIGDLYAVIEADGGWAAIELDRDQAAGLFSAHCEWEPPVEGLGQGLLAGIPAKVWVEPERVLVVVPVSMAHELDRWWS